MNPFFQGIANQLRNFFDLEALGEQFAILLTNTVVAIVIFGAFYAAWRLIRWILRIVLSRSKVDETTTAFIQAMVQFTILIVGAITALDSVGVQTSGILASLGIAGLTIGFAARDALSNLISGILIFIDRPFVIGDLVELEGFYGRVDKITLRSTRIVTVDGKMLAVPNTEVINKTVASYTNFPHIRLDLDVTVAVDEDIKTVRDVLLQMVTEDPNYLQNPEPRVVVTALNDYNVALQLQVWLENERDHIVERFELREKIFTKLTAAGIDMPFETIQLAPFRIQRNPIEKDQGN